VNKFIRLIQTSWSLLDVNSFLIDTAFTVNDFSVSKRKLATYLPESSYSVHTSKILELRGEEGRRDFFHLSHSILKSTEHLNPFIARHLTQT